MVRRRHNAATAIQAAARGQVLDSGAKVARAARRREQAARLLRQTMLVLVSRGGWSLRESFEEWRRHTAKRGSQDERFMRVRLLMQRRLLRRAFASWVANDGEPTADSDPAAGDCASVNLATVSPPRPTPAIVEVTVPLSRGGLGVVLDQEGKVLSSHVAGLTVGMRVVGVDGVRTRSKRQVVALVNESDEPQVVFQVEAHSRALLQTLPK